MTQKTRKKPSPSALCSFQRTNNDVDDSPYPPPQYEDPRGTLEGMRIIWITSENGVNTRNCTDHFSCV